MEAIQKSLEQVNKRAPGLHSKSSNPKAAAATPTVHDSIDALIARIESAKAALSGNTASPAVLAAELKASLESASKSILDRQKEFYAALSKSTKALDKKFPVAIDNVADPSLFSSPEAQCALEKVILSHLQRNGDWSTAYKFAMEAGLELDRDSAELYVKLHEIVAAMTRGDLRQAIRWAEGERDWLEARKSGLEFALHRSQFIRIAAGAMLPRDEGDGKETNRDPDGENVEMMSASMDQLPPTSPAGLESSTTAIAMEVREGARTNVERALEYGRVHFKPFRGTHLGEIQRLFTLLAFLPAFLPAPAYGEEGYDSVPVEHLLPTVPAVYRPLLDANLVHAPLLEPLFKAEFCARNRIAKDAPLAIGVEVGAGGALNRIIKVKAVMKERGNEWSQADELPVSLPPPHSTTGKEDEVYYTDPMQLYRGDELTQIEIPIPPKLRFHSIFACPVSKEQGTEENPPMMLACGHVLCLETLNRLAKGNG